MKPLERDEWLFLGGALVVLGGFLPAALLLRHRPGEPGSQWVFTLAIVEIVLGVANVALGSYVVMEMIKPKYGEGGLLTLFFMLFGAAIFLLGLTLIAAGGLHLAHRSTARFLNLCLAVLLGAGLLLILIMVPGYLKSRGG